MFYKRLKEINKSRLSSDVKLLKKFIEEEIEKEFNSPNHRGEFLDYVSVIFIPDLDNEETKRILSEEGDYSIASEEFEEMLKRKDEPYVESQRAYDLFKKVGIEEIKRALKEDDDDMIDVKKQSTAFGLDLYRVDFLFN